MDPGKSEQCGGTNQGEGSTDGKREAPLGFDVEPAIPGTDRAPNRRLFIKLTGAFAALNYVAPKMAHAGGGAELSPQAPLPLPFGQALTAAGLAGTVSNDGDADYEFALGGDISIDQTGEATIRNFSLLGTFVSGVSHGDISILQRGNAVGSYVGTTLQVSVPASYSDGDVSDVSGLVDLQGTLTVGSASFSASVVVDTVVDIGVQGFIPPET